MLATIAASGNLITHHGWRFPKSGLGRVVDKVQGDDVLSKIEGHSRMHKAKYFSQT